MFCLQISMDITHLGYKTQLFMVPRVFVILSKFHCIYIQCITVKIGNRQHHVISSPSLTQGKYIILYQNAILIVAFIMRK